MLRVKGSKHCRRAQHHNLSRRWGKKCPSHSARERSQPFSPEYSCKCLWISSTIWYHTNRNNGDARGRREGKGKGGHHRGNCPCRGRRQRCCGWRFDVQFRRHSFLAVDAALRYCTYSEDGGVPTAAWNVNGCLLVEVRGSAGPASRFGLVWWTAIIYLYSV